MTKTSKPDSNDTVCSKITVAKIDPKAAGIISSGRYYDKV
jgi:hypothetical protein